MKFRQRFKALVSGLSVLALTGAGLTVMSPPAAEAADAPAWGEAWMASARPTFDDTVAGYDFARDIVNSQVQVELVSEDAATRTQQWRITWNQRPLKYITEGVGVEGYTSDPHFTFAVSDDLAIQGKVTYKMISPNTGTVYGSGSYDPWIHEDGDMFYADANGGTGENLKDQWTSTASNCLNGGGACGNALEWSHPEFGKYRWYQNGSYASATPDIADSVFLSASHAKQITYRTFKRLAGVSSERRALKVTAEFTTKQTVQPWVSGTTYSFVLGGFKSFDSSVFTTRVSAKYRIQDNSTDTDKDGLPDAYEKWIGSDPNNVDTDGDGRQDGLEVETLKPVKDFGVWGDDSTKIVGTDPVVGIQGRPLVAPAQLCLGDKVSGTAEPLTTIALPMTINGKNVYVGSTVSDASGHYTVTIGKRLVNTQHTVNWAGNTIALNGDPQQHGNIDVKYEDVTELVDMLASSNPKCFARTNARVEVWSDGWNDRPLFSKTEPIVWGDTPVAPTSTTAGAPASTIEPPSATRDAAVTATTDAIPAANVQPVTVRLYDASGVKVTNAADALKIEAVSNKDSVGTTLWVKPVDGSNGATFSTVDTPVFVETEPGVYTTWVSATAYARGFFDVSINDNGTTRYLNGSKAGAGAIGSLDYTFLGESGVANVLSSIQKTDLSARYVFGGKEQTYTPFTEGDTVSGLMANVKDGRNQTLPAGTSVWVQVPGSDERQEVKVGEGVPYRQFISIPEFTATPGTSVLFYGSADSPTPFGTWTPKVTAAPVAAADIAGITEPVITGDTVSGATISAFTDSGKTKPAPGRTVWVTYPGQSTATPVTLDENGEYTLPDFTPTATDNTVKVYAEDPAVNTSAQPIATKEITLGVGEPSTSVSTAAAFRDNQMADGTATNAIKVTLVDRNGNAITGAASTISATKTDGVAAGEPQVRELGNGEYMVEIPSTAAGTATYEVKAGNTTIGSPVTLTWKPGNVSASESTVEITRNNASASSDETNIVRVTLKDAQGNLLSGLENDIHLADGASSTLSIAGVTPVEGQPGVYDVAVKGTTPGSYDAALAVGTTALTVPSTQLTFSTPPVDPTKSTVTVDCDPAPHATPSGDPAPADTCTVTVKLVDTTGEPITDDRSSALGLTFTNVEGGEATATGPTFANGEYTWTVSATKKGDYPLTATVGGKTITDSTGKAVSFLSGPIAEVTDVQGLPGSGDTPAATAGQPISGISFVARDANGDPLSAGEKVWVTLPGVSDTKQYTVGENGLVTITDPFTVKTAPNTGAAAQKIQVWNGDPTGDNASTIDFLTPVVAPGPFSAEHSSFWVPAEATPAGESTTLHVVPRDQYGNVITDFDPSTLTFTATRNGGTETATIGDFTYDSTAKEFTASVTATVAGDYKLGNTSSIPVDSTKGGDTATFEAGIPVLDPNAETHSAWTVQDGEATANGTDTVVVVVSLVDEYGNAITSEQAKAALSVSAGAAELKSGSPVEQNGTLVYEFTKTSPSTENVTVTYNGTPVPRDGDLSSVTFVAGPAVTTGSQYTVDSAEFVEYDGGSHTVTVALVDATGNPTTDLGGKELAVVLTDNTGEVTSTALTRADGATEWTATLTAPHKGSAHVAVTLDGENVPLGESGVDVANFKGLAATTGTLTLSDENVATADAPATAGDEVTFVYTVTDKNGKAPETLPETVTVTLPQVDGTSLEVTLTKVDDSNVYRSEPTQLKKAGEYEATVTAGENTPAASLTLHVDAAEADATTSVFEVSSGAAYGTGALGHEYNVATLTVKDEFGNIVTTLPEDADEVTVGALGANTRAEVTPLESDTPGVLRWKVQARFDAGLGAEPPATFDVPLTNAFTDTTEASTFTTPPINPESENTWFTVTPTTTYPDGKVLADGVETYTVTVHLVGTKDNAEVPLTDREGALDITGLGAATIVEPFTMTEDGTYVATVASTTPNTDQKLGVTLKWGVPLHQQGSDSTDPVAAPFSPNVVDPTKSTYTVDPSTDLTAGDPVTLTLEAKNAHGNPITNLENVTVAVPRPNGTTETVTLTGDGNGTYTASGVQLQVAGPNDLPVSVDGTDTGVTKTAEVDPGDYDPATSTLEFQDEDGTPVSSATTDDTLTLAFTPKDEFGNVTTKQVGTPAVSLTEANGTPTTPTLSDADGDGVWTATVEPSKIGDLTATVTAPTVDQTTAPTATVPVTSGAPASTDLADKVASGVTVTAGEPIPAAPSTGTVIKVYDADGQPAADGTLWVSVPGEDEPRVVEVKDGQFVLEPFTPTTAGPAAVEIRTSDDLTTDPISKVTFTVTAGVPADETVDGETASTVSAEKVGESAATDPETTALADGTSGWTVTVALKDAYGNPVTLPEAALSSLDLTTEDPAAAGKLGLADLTFTPVEGEEGVYTATVTSDVPVAPTALQVKYGNTEIGEPITVAFGAGAPNLDPNAEGARAWSYATITDGVRTADGQAAHEVTLRFSDATGNPVDVDLKDVTVELTGVAEGTTPTATVSSVTRTGTGVYTATVTDTKAETVNLRATYKGEALPDVLRNEPAELPATFVAGPPAKFVVSGADDPVAVGDSVSPTLTVTDTTGNPVANTEVWVTIGDGDPVKVTTDANGQVVLDGTEGRPGPVEPTVDDIENGVAITACPDSGCETPLEGEAVVPVKNAAPTNVDAVKDPATGDVRVTGEAPDAAPGTIVTVTLPDGTTATGTVKDDEDHTFTIDVPGTKVGDATELPVTVGTGDATSEPTTEPIVDRIPAPEVTSVRDPEAGTGTVTVTLPTEGLPADFDPATDVHLTDGTGKPIDATPVVNEDGTVTFTVEPASALPDTVEVTLGDGPTASLPESADTVVRPGTPTGVTAVKDPATGDIQVTGTTTDAPKGTTVTVTLSDGTTVTGEVVDDKGTFVVDIPADKVKDGVTPATVTAGTAPAVSEAADVPAVVTRLPQPTVTSVRDAESDTGTITATVPAGTQVTADQVHVTDGEGNPVEGTVTVNPDGTITIVVEPAADLPDHVEVVLGEGVTASKPGEADTVDRVKTPTGVAAVKDPESGVVTVSGTVPGAPKGTPVTVTLSDGTTVTVEVTDDAGHFSVDVPADKGAAGVTPESVTAGTGLAESSPADVPAVVTRLPQPTVTSVRDAESDKGTVTVTVPAGTQVTADQVHVTDGAGNPVEGTVTVNPDGSITVVVEPAADLPAHVEVVLGDGLTASKPGEADTVDRVKTPTGVAAVKDPESGVVTVSGTVPGAPKGTPVTVTLPDGSTVTAETTDDAGHFGVDAGTLNDGAEVTVTAGDAPVTSAPRTATVDTRMPQPTDVVTVNDPATGSTTLTGDANGAPDGTAVTVMDGNGETVGDGEVKNGTITVPLDPSVKPGDTVTVVVGEGDTASTPLDSTVVTKPAPVSDGKAVESDGGATVSGTTTPGATVVVTDANGESVTTTADGSGRFTVTVPGAKAGDTLTVVATKDGATSDPVTLTVDAAATGGGNGSGDGSTDGSGNGSTDGSGDGNGTADGAGVDNGSGNGAAAGNASGTGNGSGDASGTTVGKVIKGLAKTGATVGGAGALGAGLLALGGIFVIAGKRRRYEARH